ncbi:hypothetical protein D3C78_942160 [compost metagenome]
MKEFLQKIRQWARSLKHQVMVLWFCCRHPQTPWPAKLLALAVVAYALSPIDLIPDFIPVLGYLDDLILLPLGILLALRMIPPTVVEACRRQAQAWEAAGAARPRSRIAAVLIVALWLLFLAWLWQLAARYFF